MNWHVIFVLFSVLSGSRTGMNGRIVDVKWPGDVVVSAHIRDFICVDGGDLTITGVCLL